MEQLYKVSKTYSDNHQFKQEEHESVGELAQVCSRIVLTFLDLARLGRPENFWSANKLTRTDTKWTQARDRRLARLISYVHHTNHYRQYCHVGNTVQHCRLGLFQDSDFVGNFENSKSISGGIRKSNIFPTSVGCARSKRQYPTFLHNLNLSRWMLDCEWMDSHLLSTSGTW